MPGPVERWLETFMCKQYAEIFDAYGFKSLHLVCQIQIQQLQSMGIPQDHCEIIYQNVQILRQSMSGPVQHQQYVDDMRGHYSNRMSQRMQGVTYQGRESSQQQVNMNLGYNSQMSGSGNYANQRSLMMSQQFANQGSMYPQQQQDQSFMNPAYRQQYQTSSYPTHRQTDPGYSSMTAAVTSASTNSSMYNSRQPHYSGQVQGTTSIGQATIQQSHPHLRNTSQNPQEVANNILHIASSSYPSNQTVQVPLSKNRSAPYHVPPRSPHYSMDGQQQQQQQQQQQHVMGSNNNSNNQGQFVYPNSSHQQQPQHQPQHARMSPISPASGVLQSPHSHHSGHSIPSSSPCSLHSPGISNMKSPASDISRGMMHTPPSLPSSQQMSSPLRVQQHYHMTSPTSTPHQRMVSPVPVNQQLQVSVQTQSQQMYRDNLSAVSPAGSHSHSQSSAYFSSNPHNSPGGQSGHFSNISSPYTPGSKASLSSPNQPYPQSSSNVQYLNTGTGPPVDSGSHCRNPSATNPLMSLQKLCMLPERQVVDPKSVVNDACAPSPQNNEFPKNFHANADSLDSKFGIEGRHRESAASRMSEQGIDGKLCNMPLEDNKPAANTASVIQENVEINKMSEVGGAESIHETSIVANTNVANVKQRQEADYTEVDKTTRIPNVENVSDIEDIQSGAESHMDSTQGESVGVSYEKVNSTSEKTNVSPEKNNKDNTETVDKESSPSTSTQLETEEVKCQPKKMMLLRATKDHFNNTASSNQPETKTSSTEDDNMESDFCNTNNCSSEQETNTDSLENKGEVQSSHQVSVQNQSEVTNNTLCKSELIETDEKESVTVQSSSIGASFNSDISDSDDESHLIVRKDIKTTYSKHDRLKNLELTPRIRGQSTGSLSDYFENSDLEYEDHIGCDDIENDLSYCDDKDDVEVNEDVKETENVLFEVTNPLINEVKNVTMVTDKVVISSPHWKKSKLNNLQAVSCDAHDNDSCIENHTERRLANGLKTKRKRVMKKAVKRVKDIVDIDGDEIITSPTDRDLIGVEMDNGDGTMSVTRSSRLNHRLRKTPLKYKDTSFFQGDFVFVEEEEDYYEPKQRSSAKKNCIDVNHNTRKTDELKQKEQVLKKAKVTINKVGTGKKESLKEKKQKQNLNTKSKEKKIYYTVITECSDNVEDDEKSTQNETTKKVTEKISNGNAKKDEKLTCTSTPKKKEAKLETENLTNKNDIDNITKSAKNETSKKSKTSTKSKQLMKQKAESTVSKTNTSQTDCIKKESCDSTDKKNKRHPLNGISKLDRTKSCDLNSPKPDIIKVKEEENEINDKSESFVNEKNVSSDSAGICKPSLREQNKIVKKETVSSDTVYEESAIENSRDSIDSTVKVETKEEMEQEIKIELLEQNNKKGRGKRGPDAKKRKSGSGFKADSVSRRNSAKKKSASRNKRKTFDDDSDYELGPNKKSFKSMNLNRTHGLMNTKKKSNSRDKWTNFKGPLVRLEGPKEAPEKCIVINEPCEQTGSKKTKLTTQSVSTIQISHLPSDKSVLIPHSDANEGSKWECALCGKHSSYKFLGDLFGPYTVDNLTDDMDGNFHSKSVSKKRRSEEPQPGTSKSSRTSKRVVTVTKEATLWKEVWVHESCGVWSDGVFLIGTRIYGLQEAVRIASQTPCTRCHEMGAMIGCLNKGCQQKFHHACAVDSDCYLDEENFSLLCPKHKVKKLKQLETSATGMPSIS